MKKTILIICLIIFASLFSCKSELKEHSISNENPLQYITILGIAQDAGYPQIDCKKHCCTLYYDKKEAKKLVSCIGLVDLNEKKEMVI